MATKKVARKEPVLPNTPAMEGLIAAGYGISLEQAKEILATREKNPALVSYDEYMKAKAFMAAYTTKAVVIDIDNIGVRPEVQQK